MKFTFCFGGYWWSQGPRRLQFFFYKEKNGYWRRMYYQPDQWSANESNPIYLKWYWGGASSQTLVLKMKIEWEGKKWVPAEKARAEELSTKTACTLLLPDHSSKNFLYSAVISVKIPKTPRKNQTNCALKKCFHPRRRRRSGHKKERRQTEDFPLLSSSSSDLLSLSHSCNWNYVEGGRIVMILSEWGKLQDRDWLVRWYQRSWHSELWVDPEWRLPVHWLWHCSSPILALKKKQLPSSSSSSSSLSPPSPAPAAFLPHPRLTYLFPPHPFKQTNKQTITQLYNSQISRELFSVAFSRV